MKRCISWQFTKILARMVKKYIPIFLLLSAPGFAQSAAIDADSESVQIIRYPSLSVPYGQSRMDYSLAMLNLALSKSEHNYKLEGIPMEDFQESRSTLSIAKGLYDIHWMHTNETRESILLPIRIPLYKGLMGWRLLLTAESDLNRFSDVKSLQDLTQFSAVQGHDWPDSQILSHNGFKVVQTVSWEGMFRMLYAQRVDMFPRSVVEAWYEVERFSEFDLAIEPNLVLHYPTAYYFFVHRDNQQLADLINLGLNRAIADGSFEELFMAHYKEDVEKSKLSGRRVIKLENPLFKSGEEPLNRPELWYQP